ncbi:copper resistance CopC family protein [Ureibacillus sp. MALMAid1270]|uniref:copper resistance CopC family protein n=1 Tax=Ureibacillus sp. MALMAid1270 TaxID=3411629 RepID=UPI003BA7F117
MLKILRSLLISLFAILLFSITPFSTASAHSVLEDSTPADGEQLNDPINRIELLFNTKIENGSTLTLVNEIGDELKPLFYEINDNVLVAIFEDSLESGSYQVNWKVIGADGHLIENGYSFTITEPEITEDENQTTKSEEEQTNSTSEKETSPTDAGKEDDVNNKDEENPNQSSSKENAQSSLGIILIICLIIAGLGILAWMLFSNCKKS